jgi:hypothetical protein
MTKRPGEARNFFNFREVLIIEGGGSTQMPINFTGSISALAAFFGVWFGHVAVRWVEHRARDIRPAAFAFGFMGLAFLAASLKAISLTASAALGIIGVTLLWDAFEFFRQEKRIKAGHAPANPGNPRHARILEEFDSATTLDRLARQPAGRALTPLELQRIRGPRP